MTKIEKNAKRIVVAVVGATVVLLGVVMLAAPGPGVLGIAAGLAILGIEFAWARVWLGKIRRKISQVSRQQRLRNRA